MKNLYTILKFLISLILSIYCYNNSNTIGVIAWIIIWFNSLEDFINTILNKYY